MKIPDDKLEELKRQTIVDNSRLEELIKDMERMISDALALNKLNTLDKSNTNFVSFIISH